METEIAIDVTKEKNSAKDVLKLVEKSIEEEKIKVQRKSGALKGRIISPSVNWNMVRKQIEKQKTMVKVPEDSDKPKKNKKKKRKDKDAQKANDNTQNEVKGASVADLVFNPQKHGKSKDLTPIVALD